VWASIDGWRKDKTDVLSENSVYQQL